MANIFDAIIRVNETTEGQLNTIETELTKDIQAIAFDDIHDSSGVENGQIEYYCDLRWSIQPEHFSVIASKHNVKIEIRGCEDSLGFYQVVVVSPEGEVLKNEELSFYD